ncbi:MAG: DUF1801 domain-containing protein [Chitinophagaceae bacterium]|nr:DUF1801 domain-containing protein [Chitinophagaceae bacterium]
MAELKTKKNNASVEAFLQTIKEESKRRDCITILAMMKKITQAEPKMWGSSIVGFGTYHYKSERSKQEGDWFITGFSPRKQNLTLYIMPGIDYYKDLVKKLGKCKTSVSCLYINKLADVDMKVLNELVTTAYKRMKEMTNISK